MAPDTAKEANLETKVRLKAPRGRKAKGARYMGEIAFVGICRSEETLDERTELTDPDGCSGVSASSTEKDGDIHSVA